MAYTVQLVDSIAASPTVLLDLNDNNYWRTLNTDAGTSFDPPPLERAVVSTMLADGDLIPASAYGNRVVHLVLDLTQAPTDDAAATELQSLQRELAKSTPILRYQPESTNPVFFRIRSGDVSTVTWDSTQRRVTATLICDPFGYGVEQTLSAVSVYNDPDHRPALNANPDFETDVSNWTGAGGATISRDTTRAQVGSASMKIVSAGNALSERFAVTANADHIVQGWFYPSGGAGNRFIRVYWFDGGGAAISNVDTVVSMSGGSWSMIGPTVVTSPAGAATAQLGAFTNVAGETLNVDGIQLGLKSATPTGCLFDVSSPLGDVETPLYLSIAKSSFSGQGKQAVFGVRRRGTPSSAPLVLQCEAMTPSTDTALGAANDTAMSGPGQNYLRTTFATTTTLNVRAIISSWPAAAGVDVRGTYRVFVRYRKTVGTDVMALRMEYGAATTVFSDTVSLPTQTNNHVKWADMGLLQIPIGADPGQRGPSGVDLSAGPILFQIDASRTSGSGNLDLDCLLLVPADDRLCIASLNNPPATASAYVLDSSRGMVYTVGSSGEVVGGWTISLVGAGPMVTPGRTNRVVVLPNTGQFNAPDTVTDTMVITPSYWPKYLEVRPAAS